MMTFTTLVSTLLAFVATAVASPIAAQQLDVFSPTITSPTAAANWTTGSTHNVTWRTHSFLPLLPTKQFMASRIISYIQHPAGQEKCHGHDLTWLHSE